VIVIRGVLDGLVFGKSPLVTQDSMMDYLDTTYGHLIEALDQFYSDYRNEGVFLVWALQLISLEMRGTAPKVVEARLVEMRRQAAEFHKAMNR